jgi:hypothetical protein
MTSTSTLAGAFARRREAQAVLRGRSLTPFDIKVGEAVFNGAMLAMEDAEKDRDVSFRVVSCPTGSGKTSASLAFIAAAFETDPGFTAAYVTDTIAQAEEVRRELALLVGGENVTCWTSKHDAVENPDSSFDWKGTRPAFHPVRSDLSEARLVVATHTAWKGELEGDRRRGIRFLGVRRRSVVFVDEHPDLVRMIERTPADIARLRDRILAADPASPLVDALNGIYRRTEEAFLSKGRSYSAPELVDPGHLDAFRSLAPWDLLGFARAGEGTDQRRAEAADLEATCRFIQAAARGCAFLCRSPVTLLAYELQHEPGPGHVLLDATADLTGMVALMPGMEVVEVPEVDYRNLTIHHVGQHSDERMKDIIRDPDMAKSYAEFVKRTVLDNTVPGELVLAVVHKALLKQWYLKRPDSPDTTLVWEDRQVHMIHWGTGIGSNRFKHAQAVFLFSEFFIPRRISIAQVHGWTGRRPTEVEMEQASLPYIPRDYLTASEGHLLRWTKQLACRGNVRNIDAEGRCGTMRLYTSMDRGRLLANVGRLFPGAPPPLLLSDPEETDTDMRSSTDSLVALLANRNLETLKSSEVEELTGIPSRNLKRTCRTPQVSDAMRLYGWTLVPGRGRGNQSRLERVRAMAA